MCFFLSRIIIMITTLKIGFMCAFWQHWRGSKMEQQYDDTGWSLFVCNHNYFIMYTALLWQVCEDACVNVVCITVSQAEDIYTSICVHLHRTALWYLYIYALIWELLLYLVCVIVLFLTSGWNFFDRSLDFASCVYAKVWTTMILLTCFIHPRCNHYLLPYYIKIVAQLW